MTLSAAGTRGGRRGPSGRRGRFADALDARLAETAIQALLEVTELTPKPGLTDTRHSAPGHLAPGYLAPRHSAPGHLALGHSASGHLALGHSALGHSASGHSASGHSASGHLASGHSASGHSASGHSASGHSASGHLASGHSASGHSAPGHLLPGAPVPRAETAPRAAGARPVTPDPGTLRWAARALAPGLTAMAAAARRTGAPTPELRAELGAIGRSTEWTVRRAACGTRTHHGAIWVLGLLVAASALEPGAAPGELGTVVKRLAAHRDRGAPLRPSRGSTVSVRYGAAGARGEARAGLPHVRRALDALRTARNTGADETGARIDALLTVMSTLQDTHVLYEAGPHGLRRVQSGARSVLDAGGTAAEEGREALAAFDADLRAHALSPAGSIPLLAGALYAERAASAASAASAAPAPRRSGSGPVAGVRAGA